MKIFISVLFTIVLTTAAATAQTQSLRKTDWANFTFRIADKTVKMYDGLQVGACAQKDEDGIPIGDIWSVIPENVAYGDLDGDGAEDAIIPVIANVCGGNLVTDEAVLVYSRKNGKATKLPQFEYFDEGCKAGEKGCYFSRNPGVSVAYDALMKSLVIETFFATDNDAACCPSLSRKTWYKWNGSAFVETKKTKIFAVKKQED